MAHALTQLLQYHENTKNGCTGALSPAALLAISKFTSTRLCGTCDGATEVACTGGEIDGECIGQGCDFCGGDTVLECSSCEGTGKDK